MSRSAAGRISMAAVSPPRHLAVARGRLRPHRHLGGIAGEGPVVGERGRVVAGVALVGAGAAGAVVERAADLRELGVRRERRRAGQAGADGSRDELRRVLELGRDRVLGAAEEEYVYD